MKVLFAVSSERISETIIKKYQKEYKEILSYKNVYYFNAILKEIQKDKSYDRIVISEDLEPFSTNNYDSIDKFIFEKLDDISDEAEDIDGNDTSIVLICTDRHTKGSDFLVKLFGIGIYNALLGNDRSMENVCKLIKKPRTKKEAKMYYKIDSDDVNYSNKSDKEVNEVEIQNILNHFKKLGRNTSKYSESFANIASQYTDEQLRIIINCLPINVKAVLEGESPKYQELMSVNGIMPKTLASEAKERDDKERTGLSIDILENKNRQMSGPVVIPSTVRNSKNSTKPKKAVNDVAIPKMNTEENKVRKVVKKREEPSIVEDSTRRPKSNSEKLHAKRENVSNEEVRIKKKVRPNLINEEPEKIVKPSIENDINNVDNNDNASVEDKKGRGRPRKDPAPLPFKDNSKKAKKPIEDDDDEEENVFLPGMLDDEENNYDSSSTVEDDNDVNYEEDYIDEENDMLPGIGDEEDDDEYDDDVDNTEESEDEMLPGVNEEDDYSEDYYDDEDDSQYDDSTEDVEYADDDNSEEVEYVDDDNYDDNSEEVEYVDDEDDVDYEDDTDEDVEYIDDEDDLEEVDDDNVLPGMDDEYTDEVELPGLDELDEDEYEEVPKSNNADEEDDDLLTSFDDEEDDDQDDYNSLSSNSNQIESIKPRVDYSMSSLNSLMTKDKKIVTFLGTTKNGTSFLVNNLAALFSTCGINTAILDMTRNKNSYYIYTNNEEELRNIAYNSISKLQKGFAEGIKVDKNVTVYTALPNDGKDYSDAESILSTLVQNHSLILIDCDFDTDPAYFASCQEIYLVQSMDILTIQPLTAFLRDLKAKGVLEAEKVRVVINKEVPVKSLTTKAIIGGMSFYNDPAMSFMTELFNKDMVKACSIPFEDNSYSKYLDSMVNCSISLRGYSKAFINKLKNLGDMVYPLVSKSSFGGGKNDMPGNGKKKPFSNNMNNTLNQMRKKY